MDEQIEFEKLRKEYAFGGLDEKDCGPDPFLLFGRWLAEAVQNNLPESNAMVLSSASRHGVPSSRMVLLKDVNRNGFAFFTNYESRKGLELAQNSNAALLFFWAPLERQIRIEGVVAKMERSDSEKYFHARPRGSQISAWASQQSSVVADRMTLETKMEKLIHDFGEGEIPAPPHWGGYRLKPAVIEFWQGRQNRLHDRLRYTLKAEQIWVLERLAP